MNVLVYVFVVKPLFNLLLFFAPELLCIFCAFLLQPGGVAREPPGGDAHGLPAASALGRGASRLVVPRTLQLAVAGGNVRAETVGADYVMGASAKQRCGMHSMLGHLKGNKWELIWLCVRLLQLVPFRGLG